MYQLQLFKYEDKNSFVDVTAIEINGEPWFIAKEICEILKFEGRVYDALRVLDADEKGTHQMRTLGGMQDVSVISESGLYALIFRSRITEAKKFRKWITSEVIPAIRKTGSYSLGGKPQHSFAFVARYHANTDNTSPGHFSVIGETFARLYSKFELAGHIISERSFDGKTENRPDNSVGSWFVKHLKKSYPELVDSFSYYDHVFPNGTVFPARQYPNSMLGIFQDFLLEVWLPEQAKRYFTEEGRDIVAVDYVDKIVTKLKNAPAPKRLK